MASIVDKPKESTQSDLLEMEKYTDGLIQFIEHSATPITIGVQGEWGSGKTSLLNTIKQDLCDKPSAKHYPVWINTWKYSLLSSPDETLVKIISGLVNQIGELTKNKNSERSKKLFASVGSAMKGFGGVMGGFGGKAIEMAGEIVETSATDKPENNSVEALQNALQAVINEAIETSDKKAFIFFIDDLDRLDPAVAVNILELIKNIFDLEKCIFVLAIDYGVVIKGLVPKFGKMTEENEWEFRAFFDKIIQLPFSMPISSYNIGKYLQSLLVDVNYFAKDDLLNKEVLSKITSVVGLSVGTNPRALKRLANSVSLIEIIRGDEKITADERVIEFALICIQIAYPFIYTLVVKESDFTQWSDQLIYNVIKNTKIDEKDLEELKESEEFDEEWEQNVWRVCQVSSFLKQRAYQVSKLFNFIKNNMPESKEEEMGETLDRLLSMSSVTSVSAESVDTGKKAFQKTIYDDWASYVESIKDKKLPQEIIDEAKEIIDKIQEYIGENCEVKYTPTLIALRSKIAKGRQKRFGAIRIKKKGIDLELVDTDGTLRKIFPEGRIYHEKYLYIYITNDNIEEKFFPYIKEKFDEISGDYIE